MEDEGIELGVWQIISGMFGELAKRPLPYAVFVAGMALATTILDQVSEGSGTAVMSILGIFTGFALLRYVFAAEGIGGSQSFGSGLVSYFGASFLSGVGIILGLIFFFVPGILFAARWSIATGLVICEDKTAIDSMKRSWELTLGSQFPIIGAFVLVSLPALVLLFMLGGGIGYFESDAMLGSAPTSIMSFGASLLINVASNAFSVMGVAGVLFLTRSLAPAKGQLEQVFA